MSVVTLNRKNKIRNYAQASIAKINSAKFGLFPMLNRKNN